MQQSVLTLNMSYMRFSSHLPVFCFVMLFIALFSFTMGMLLFQTELHPDPTALTIVGVCGTSICVLLARSLYIDMTYDDGQ